MHPVLYMVLLLGATDHAGDCGISGVDPEAVSCSKQLCATQELDLHENKGRMYRPKEYG